jgi:predicted dehydrogenase
MKGLVVGGGSIGARHLRNLKALGVESLGLAETDVVRRQALAIEHSAESVVCLDDGLAWLPDFVVLATPTHLHAEQPLTIVKGGFPLFIEKPLSHTWSHLAEISEIAERKSLISMVGCNMRFHPGPAQVKELLQEDRVGAILCARLQAGSYLPEWRPASDYRDNYAAREETGGGCILDCIHEIDLARWYLGDVRQVFCMAGHLSSLEIGTEDVAALLCRHTTGTISEIHLDYVQRTYERGCQIVGEQGTIFWDFASQQVRLFEAENRQWVTFPQPAGWELNQMYMDEMKYFVDCVRAGAPTMLPIAEAVAVMQIAFAAKTSAREGRLVTTGREVLA